MTNVTLTDGELAMTLDCLNSTVLDLTEEQSEVLASAIYKLQQAWENDQ